MNVHITFNPDKLAECRNKNDAQHLTPLPLPYRPTHACKRATLALKYRVNKVDEHQLLERCSRVHLLHTLPCLFLSSALLTPPPTQQPQPAFSPAPPTSAVLAPTLPTSLPSPLFPELPPSIPFGLFSRAFLIEVLAKRLCGFALHHSKHQTPSAVLHSHYSIMEKTVGLDKKGS